jgi:hypothetical protein
VLLDVFSHEHNLLPFSTPQYNALLSTKSEAADSANKKERLGVSHDIHFDLVNVLY